MPDGTTRAEVKSPVQSIDRAVKLLSLLADAGSDGLQLRQLAAVSGLKTSTAHSLLSALVAHRLAEQLPDDRRYRLGSAALDLHRRFLAQSDLASIAARPARELWVRTDETVFVSVLRGADRVDLISLLGPQSLSINVRGMRALDGVAWRFGLHASAAGKILLAGMPPESAATLLRAQGLPPLTERTTTDLDAVLAEVAAARIRGLATNVEESDVGVCGVAAPLVDSAGATVGAICVAYPASRHSDGYFNRLEQETRRAARKISELLGAPRSAARVIPTHG